MKTGIYKHYSGKLYEVIGLALHTETREKHVLYKALYETPELEEEYGKSPFFIRPYKLFSSTEIINGKKIKKFNYIGDNKYENI